MAPGKQQFNLQSTGSGSTTWSGGMDDLQKLLSNFRPTKLDDCSTSFSSAAGKLQATADEIYTVGFQLSQLWKGDAAAKAQEQLKQLWETSQSLADTAAMVGNNLFHNHAQTLKDAPKQAPQPSHTGRDVGTIVGVGLGPLGALGGNYLGGKIDDSHNDDMARDWVNNTLTPAAVSDNSGVPENFRTDLPDAKQALNDPNNKKQPTFNGGGGLPHGGGGGGLPHGGGVPGGKLPTHPNGNLPIHPGGNLPTHPNGNLPIHPGGNLPNHGGSDLAGFHPGGGLPGGGGLGPGLGGGGGGLGGGGLGGGLGGAGGGLGGGLGGPGLNGAGSLAAEEAAAAERAAMAGKGGANGMPMGGMGGGGGGQKEERERTTWLSEDEDVWGGDGDTAPPVIG